MVGRLQVAKRIGGCSTGLLLRGCWLGISFIGPLKNGLNLILVFGSPHFIS